MARDVNEFVSEALKDGHRMEDIVSFMSSHDNDAYKTWATNWQSTANAPAYKAGAADQQIAFDEEKDRLRKEFDQKLKKATTTDVFGMEIPSLLTGPGTGIAALAGAGALGVYAGKKLLDRSIKNPQIAEAVGDVAKAVNKSVEVPTEVAKPSPIEELQRRKEQLMGATQRPAPVAPPAGPTYNVPTANIPQVGVQAPVAAPVQAPMGAIAPQQAPATVTEAVVTGQSPSKAIQTDVAQQLDAAPQKLVTGTGREVVAGTGAVPKRFSREYASAADVPKGYFFLPQGQYIDVLRNDLGQQTYIDQFTGKPFPTEYSQAVQEAKDINRQLNRPTREQLKASGAAMPEPTEGIVKKVGPNKIVKAGGIAGALIALTDLAKANTSEEKMNAGLSLLGAILPPGADVMSAESPGVSSDRFEQAALLGSPYAQTEWAKAKRQSKAKR